MDGLPGWKERTGERTNRQREDLLTAAAHPPGIPSRPSGKAKEFGTQSDLDHTDKSALERNRIFCTTGTGSTGCSMADRSAHGRYVTREASKAANTAAGVLD